MLIDTTQWKPKESLRWYGMQLPSINEPFERRHQLKCRQQKIEDFTASKLLVKNLLSNKQASCDPLDWVCFYFCLLTWRSPLKVDDGSLIIIIDSSSTLKGCYFVSLPWERLRSWCWVKTFKRRINNVQSPNYFQSGLRVQSKYVGFIISCHEKLMKLYSKKF